MDATDHTVETATAPVEQEGVGTFLRQRRIALNLSHADVSHVVKVSPRRIQALEDERWDELPDGPFLRGFLKNVARALDLDVASLTARVDASLMSARNPESILVSPVTTQATMPRRRGPMDERHGSRRWIFGAFVFAIIAAVIAWSGTESFERTVTNGRALIQPPTAVARADLVAPEASPAASDAPAVPSEPGDPSAAAAVATPAAAGPSAGVASSSIGLLFHFNEESWVEVRSADGRVLMKSLNAAGSDQQVDGVAPFSLIVGNAKGVALRFHGQPVDLGPYTRDQVARLTLS